MLSCARVISVTRSLFLMDNETFLTRLCGQDVLGVLKAGEPVYTIDGLLADAARRQEEPWGPRTALIHMLVILETAHACARIRPSAVRHIMKKYAVTDRSESFASACGAATADEKKFDALIGQLCQEKILAYASPHCMIMIPHGAALFPHTVTSQIR